MGAHPRWIRSDLVYSNTQRTVDRQYLFKPSHFLNNLIGASAARAQQKHPVKLYWLEFNINHEQEGVAALSDDPQHLENVVKFKQLFHRLIAEGINRELGREGPVFSTPARTVPCLDNESLERQFFYALTNPAKDGLVERMANWKGFSSYGQLAQGKDMVYKYHDRTAWHKSRKKKALGAFLKSIRLEFTPLPSIAHLSEAEQQRHIRAEVRLLEKAFREEREALGRKAMTPLRLERTDERDRPSNLPVKTPNPLCHCESRSLAAGYEAELREFFTAYRRASAEYRQGFRDTVFPSGSFRPPLIELAA